MKYLNKLLIGVALLFSISAGAEASWKFIGTDSNTGNKLYVLLPIEYDLQYAYTVAWVRLFRAIDIQGWIYDARSIGADIRVNCDVGSVKFRTLVAFSNSNLTGHRVRLAYIIQENGVKIRPGSTLSYNRLSPVGKRAVRYICR